MHSSTSNSNGPEKWPETYWKRPIPTAHWRGVSLLAVLLTVVLLMAWETYWRLYGYQPGYEDSAEHWARMRDKVGTGSAEEVVLTGSSRMHFDFDLDVWEQDFGGPMPIMLPRVGTNPRPFITNIANDPEFRGILLVGVVEGLFFTPDGIMPAERAQQYLNHYENRPLSERWEFLLSVPFQSGLASLNAEDLGLGTLLRKRWTSVGNRKNAYIMPDMPPYLGRIDPDRRHHMWRRCERDPVLQQKIQQIWMPWFTMGPPFGGEGLDALLASVKRDVEKIRERGGEVVFIRFPSSGKLLEVEKERWPREAYWDRLLRETEAPGIHFEDHASLSGFECPEWSHLTRADAVTWTRNMIPFLRPMLSDRIRQ